MNRKIELSALVLALAALVASASMARASGAEAVAERGDPAAPELGPAELAEAKAIFETNCSSCHELTDATSQAKDLAGWTETIAKMVSYGAPIATEDQETIAAYLAATYPAAGG